MLSLWQEFDKWVGRGAVRWVLIGFFPFSLACSEADSGTSSQGDVAQEVIDSGGVSVDVGVNSEPVGEPDNAPDECETDCPDVVQSIDVITPPNECEILGEGAACDDKNACTTDDQCEEGVCVGRTPPDCEDGNVCTDGYCDPKFGCLQLLVDGECSDGDVCTGGDTCLEGECLPGQPRDCDDGDLCTVDACDGEAGCFSQALDCDDDNPCTADSCQQGECFNEDLSDPFGKGVVCTLHGELGTEIECPLQLVRSVPAGQGAYGLQLQFKYPTDRLALLYFTCPGCAQAIPPGTQLSTGHLVSMAPSKPTDWNGFVKMVLMSLTSPGQITKAYIDTDSSISGDPVFLTAHFSLLGDASQADPVAVVAHDIVASNASAVPLSSRVIGGRIVTSPYEVTCEENGAICDDGDLCTLNDLCVAKVCVGQPDCDDGNPCTLDVCVPDEGCLNTAQVEGCACSDGDPCTVGDQCGTEGCVGEVDPSCP